MNRPSENIGNRSKPTCKDPSRRRFIGQISTVVGGTAVAVELVGASGCIDELVPQNASRHIQEKSLTAEGLEGWNLDSLRDRRQTIRNGLDGSTVIFGSTGPDGIGAYKILDNGSIEFMGNLINEDDASFSNKTLFLYAGFIQRGLNLVSAVNMSSDQILYVNLPDGRYREILNIGSDAINAIHYHEESGMVLLFTENTRIYAFPAQQLQDIHSGVRTAEGAVDLELYPTTIPGGVFRTARCNNGEILISQDGDGVFSAYEIGYSDGEITFTKNNTHLNALLFKTDAGYELSRSDIVFMWDDDSDPNGFYAWVKNCTINGVTITEGVYHFTNVRYPDPVLDEDPEPVSDAGDTTEMDAGPDASDTPVEVVEDIPPDTIPDVVPDETIDVDAGHDPDMRPDIEDMHQDVIPDTPPDVIPDTVPDITEDVADAVEDVINPDTRPDAQQDPVPDVRPDGSGDTNPLDTRPDTTADTSETTPDTPTADPRPTDPPEGCCTVADPKEKTPSKISLWIAGLAAAVAFGRRKKGDQE